jgi:hypothetical protein
MSKFVRVTECRFNSCGFTVGQEYELHKDYSNNTFVDGEEYVIDDNDKINYGIFMLCKTKRLL